MSTYSNAAFSGQFLFCFLRRIGIAQVAVEILIENLRSLFAEITTLSSSIQKPWPKEIINLLLLFQ